MIWEFFRHTPVYVYVVFAYLVISGLQASRDRVIPIFKPVILTVLFLILSLDTLLRVFSVNCISIGIWLVGSIIGFCLGWLQAWRRNIKVDKQKKKLFLPGTSSTLLIALFIFALKYYIGYTRHEYPERLQQVGFQIFAVLLSGWSSTLFLGRLVNYFYRLKHDSHTDLG
jgi:hypothetical protein